MENLNFEWKIEKRKCVKAISLALSACILFTSIPMPVMASEYESVFDENKIFEESERAYREFSDDMEIQYNFDPTKSVSKNAPIVSSSGNAVYIQDELKTSYHATGNATGNAVGKKYSAKKNVLDTEENYYLYSEDKDSTTQIYGNKKNVAFATSGNALLEDQENDDVWRGENVAWSEKKNVFVSSNAVQTEEEGKFSNRFTDSTSEKITKYKDSQVSGDAIVDNVAVHYKEIVSYGEIFASSGNAIESASGNASDGNSNQGIVSSKRNSLIITESEKYEQHEKASGEADKDEYRDLNVHITLNGYEAYRENMTVSGDAKTEINSQEKTKLSEIINNFYDKISSILKGIFEKDSDEQKGIENRTNSRYEKTDGYMSSIVYGASDVTDEENGIINLKATGNAKGYATGNADENNSYTYGYDIGWEVSVSGNATGIGGNGSAIENSKLYLAVKSAYTQIEQAVSEFWESVVGFFKKTHTDQNDDQKPEEEKNVHHFETEFTIDLEPTCTMPGSKSKHCISEHDEMVLCTERSEITELPALGHQFSEEGTVTKKATELQAGEIIYKCVRPGCIETKTEEIARIEVREDPETNNGWKDILEEDKEIFGGISSEIEDKITYAGIKESVIYTGLAQTFDVRVYNGNLLLIENKDYTVKYLNNKNVGEATIKITGKGSYAGKISDTRQFQITPIDFSHDARFAVANQTVVENGRAQNPTLSLTFNGSKLKKGKDFTVEYADGQASFSAPGTYTITLVGCGNYKGTKESTFTILPKATEEKLLSKVTIKGVKNKGYNGGEAVEQEEFSVKYKSETLEKDNDYTVSYFNNTEIGTATMILTAVPGSGYVGEKMVTFKVSGKAISAATVSIKDAKKQVYTGKRVTPDVTVTYKKEALEEGTDYTIEYQKNVNTGKAVVIITGKGIYYGTVKKTFSIAAAKITSNSMVVSEIPDQEYTGSKITPQIKVTYAGKLLSQGIDYTVSYKNNVNIATAQAKKAPQLTIKMKGNYSGTKTVKFNIVHR